MSVVLRVSVLLEKYDRANLIALAKYAVKALVTRTDRVLATCHRTYASAALVELLARLNFFGEALLALAARLPVCARLRLLIKHFRLHL